jgi:hypothetical protein
MNYIDFAIASSIFIIFFGVALIFSTNYFSNLSGLTKTSEFRSFSENFFKIFFESKGVPENWDDYPNAPVKIGLAEDLYLVSVLVKETNGSIRTNEPVTAQIIFDENCQNKSWNNSVRMYDEDWNQINLEISNTTNCTSQYLNHSNITWNVDISANQTKKYYLYYSPDNEITDPNYTALTYNTSSWIPSDKDKWTETTANWTVYDVLQGSTGTVTNDTINKIRGNSSVNVTGTFSSNGYLGLQYLSFGSSDDITGISNDWYIDAWIYVDNKTGINHVYVELWDSQTGANGIQQDIYNNISNSTWYHFEKQLDKTLWDSQPGSFNASAGIDSVLFYMANTSNVIRTVKVDGLHFKKKPLEVKTFPEEKITAISATKFDVLKNISYDDVRKTIGENYKFRLEVGNETYGGNVNMSSNVGCSEYPKIVENKNGTVSKTIAKMCVWK